MMGADSSIMIGSGKFPTDRAGFPHKIDRAVDLGLLTPNIGFRGEATTFRLLDHGLKVSL
jgi:hypothetical protein